ncbi:MAG: WbqC family protein [Bacteroidales bacterium]|nr:WbqC family protein [Bacteroidales bacterium]
MSIFYLSTAYFPPISWFNKVYNASEVFIEAHENFSKQSYRNRCEIASANGKLSLCIPTIKEHGNKILIKDAKIDYREDWQKNHLKAIESAYRNSPFFEYYIDEFEPILKTKFEFLFDLNLEIIQKVKKILSISTQIIETNEFSMDYEDESDYRFIIHPKSRVRKKDSLFESQPYYQVFSEKYGFLENLSILDLIFNMGNESVNYLKINF